METIWEEPPEYTTGRTVTVPKTPMADRMQKMQDEILQLKRERESKEESKPFKFPFKWRWKFGQARRKVNVDKILIFFLNKKNEIEPPMFVPIYSGNIVIYKNKAYEFDPRGIWRMKGVKGVPSVYLIKEIDRRPITNPKTGKYLRDSENRIIFGKDAAVSNMDIDEIRARGDSTESDEFLIKAALKAHLAEKNSKPVNWIIIGIVMVVLCVGAFFLLRSNLGS